jgi:hypothetical protein
VLPRRLELIFKKAQELNRFDSRFDESDPFLARPVPSDPSVLHIELCAADNRKVCLLPKEGGMKIVPGNRFEIIKREIYIRTKG